MDPDIKHMYDFLRSKNGGAWEEEEVWRAPNATSREVLDCLRGWAEEGISFVFVQYAGHGGTNEQGRQFVPTKGGGYLYVSALGAINPRQLTIVDACRTVVRLRNPLLEKTAEVGALAGVNPYYYERRHYRSAYDGAIASLMDHEEKSQALMLSCGFDQEAGDMPSGGLYTSTLLDIVRGSSEPTEKMPGPVPVRTMFDEARQRVLNARPEQVPELKMSGEGGLLPFMIY